MEIDFYDSEFIKILEAYMRKEEFQVVESSIYYEKVNSEIPYDNIQDAEGSLVTGSYIRPLTFELQLNFRF